MGRARIRDTPQGGEIERLMLGVAGGDFPEVLPTNIQSRPRIPAEIPHCS